MAPHAMRGVAGTEHCPLDELPDTYTMSFLIKPAWRTPGLSGMDVIELCDRKLSGFGFVLRGGLADPDEKPAKASSAACCRESLRYIPLLAGAVAKGVGRGVPKGEAGISRNVFFTCGRAVAVAITAELPWSAMK